MAFPGPRWRSSVVAFGLGLALPAGCNSDSDSVAATGGGGSGGLAGSGTGGTSTPSTPGGRENDAGAGPAGGGAKAAAGSGGTTGLGGSAQATAGSEPDPSDGGDSAAGGSATGGVNAANGGSSDGGSATGGEQNSGTGGGTDPPDDPPTVLLLLDSSSSMFAPAPPAVAPRPWDWVFEALMAEDGPIYERQGRIRFGFTAYRGSATAHAEEDPACAELSTVDFGIDQYAEIRAFYETLGADYEEGVKWETPTGHAVRRATEALLDDEAPGRKYIVLVTDGIPNTCQTLDPQCGQDQAIFAVQQANEAGITTYGLGIGDITNANGNTGCDPLIARCGADHLQDLANAGLGLPVLEPPDAYLLQPCVNAVGGYVATYSADGGSAPAYVTTSVEELTVALAEVFEMIVAGAP